MRYTLSLWGWAIANASERLRWLAPVRWILDRLGVRDRRERMSCLWNCIILEAVSSKVNKWRMTPAGCGLSDALIDEGIRRYAKFRTEMAEQARATPFVMPELPPGLSPQQQEKAEQWEREQWRRRVENMDRDIARETAMMERMRRFRGDDWPLLVTRVWEMSAQTRLDQLLFRPARHGRGRTIQLVISGHPYCLGVDVNCDSVDCALTSTGEEQSEISPAGLRTLREMKDKDEWWA